jgi:drug/metabolite transporter (DMT)-like permease
MSSHTRGLTVGFAAVLLFGFTVVLQALLVDEGIASFAAVGIRYLWSGIVCLAIVIALRRPVLPTKGERAAAVLLGAVVYGFQAVLFYAALGHGTVASVSLLFYTYPILVLIGSLLLGLRSWSWLAGGAAAMSALGAALVVAAGREVTIDGLGILMALGSSCCVAVFLLANNRLIPRTPALVAATWVSFGVAASTLTLALLLGEFHAFSTRAWLILFVTGTTTGLGTAAMYVSLAALGAAPTSVLLSLQTIVAIVGSALLLGQPVLAGQILGGIAIIGSIALSAYGNRTNGNRTRSILAQTPD